MYLKTQPLTASTKTSRAFKPLEPPVFVAKQSGNVNKQHQVIKSTGVYCFHETGDLQTGNITSNLTAYLLITCLFQIIDLLQRVPSVPLTPICAVRAAVSNMPIGNLWSVEQNRNV